MVNLPGDCNSARVAVGPGGLVASSDRMNGAAQNINAALGDVMGCLDGLRLSWTGDSDGAAAIAQDFHERWSRAMMTLYGVPGSQGVDALLRMDAPGAVNPRIDGVLNALTEGVAKAAQNYANCEGAVAAMFNEFETALLRGGGSPGTVVDVPSGTPRGNYHTTAVDETGV